MSQDFCLRGKPGQYELWVRIWYGGSEPPGGGRTARLTDEEANILRSSTLFDDERAQWPSEPEAPAKVSTLLRLVEDGLPVVEITLPEIAGKRSAKTVKMVDTTDWLLQLRHEDPAKTAGFLAQTGLQDPARLLSHEAVATDPATPPI
jgi:hypothetical protein